MAIRLFGWWADTTPSAGKSYVEVEVTAGYTLNRVEVKGAIGVPSANFVAGNTPGVTTMWGIQIVDHGDTPPTLPADLATGNWLMTEVRRPTDKAIVWAPSTDTAEYAEIGGIDLVWAGAVPITADSDIVFTTGELVSTSGWLTQAGINVWIS